jgi:acyl-CoA hydrolase
MESYTVVRPEHLNHHGYLFGGVMLKWVDEFAWIAASLQYRGCTMVTAGMDEIQFREKVVNGSILRFWVTRLDQGRSSVRFRVEVFADAPGATAARKVFATRITFVRVDADGRKCPLPKPEAPQPDQAGR